MYRQRTPTINPRFSSRVPVVMTLNVIVELGLRSIPSVHVESVCCAASRQRREEERLQREIQQREQEEALALLEGQKKRGKGIKLRVRLQSG